MDGDVFTFTYNSDGIRTSKTVNGVKHTYNLNGTQIVSEEWGNNIIVYLYDANGAPIGMQYLDTSSVSNVWQTFWYEKDMLGNIVAVYSNAGVKLISYKYDAWGGISETNHAPGSSTAAHYNPFRYRGYYYDVDLKLYYLNSRYYDPIVGMFISPDDASYLGANGDLISYNLYAYCSNNPVNFVDPSGNSIISVFLWSVGIGIVAGGTVGGIIAYNAAASSGSNGSDTFYQTVSGVGKGAVAGGVAGALAGANIVSISTFGPSSVAGTAVITGTMTIAARAVEVGALQYQKSTMDGNFGWQTADDVLSSTYNNIHRILDPIGMKAVTTANGYIAYYKLEKIGFKSYAALNLGKTVSYAFAAYAWIQTGISIYTQNPLQRAYERGYTLI